MVKKSLLIFFIFSILSFISFKIWEIVKSKERVNSTLKSIPSFSFNTLKNKGFNNDSLLPNRKTLLLFFNTTCEHCQYETEEIIKNKSAFTNTNVLFISTEPIEFLKAYDSIYSISDNFSMKLLQDSLDNTSKVFGINSNPSSIIYDAKGNLVKSFKGEVKIEALISLLQ